MVSVVIPLYNKAQHIERAVRSVLSQSVNDFEVIVVDDGSTDGGGAVVQAMHDTRVRVIATENRGVSAARNRGIRAAKYDLVAFLDADDEWLPNFLDAVLRLHQAFPSAALCACAMMHVSPDGMIERPVWREVPRTSGGGIVADYWRAASAGYSPVCSSNVLSKKTVLSDLGGFPENLRNVEDVVVWTKIALRHPIAWTPTVASIRHKDAENRASAFIPTGIPPFSECLQQYLRESPDQREVPAAAQAYIVRQELQFVTRNLIAGERKSAILLLRSSARLRGHRARWCICAILSVLPLPLIRAIWVGYWAVHGRGWTIPPARSIFRTPPADGTESSPPQQHTPVLMAFSATNPNQRTSAETKPR